MTSANIFRNLKTLLYTSNFIRMFAHDEDFKKRYYLYIYRLILRNFSRNCIECKIGEIEIRRHKFNSQVLIFKKPI